MRPRLKLLVPLITLLLLSLAGVYFLVMHSEGGPLPEMRPASVQTSTQSSLTATYMGTSTILFNDGETQILIDGFFTRPDLKTVMFGSLQSNPDVVRQSLAKLNISKLDLVAVVHSHHDHAMDAPEVAKQTGAIVLGSESTANIARGAGLPESQIHPVTGTESLQVGNFRITMIASKHTPVPAPIARLTGIGKTIDQPLPQPARLWKFNEGGSYAVHLSHPSGNILVQASGGFIPGLLADYPAETVFYGIASLSKQPPEFQQQYYEETIILTGAKHIIPIHWDNFFKPLHLPLTPFPTVIDDTAQTLNALAQRAEQHAARLTLLQGWETITLSSP